MYLRNACIQDGTDRFKKYIISDIKKQQFIFLKLEPISKAFKNMHQWYDK